jgi:hypothetical protein
MTQKVIEVIGTSKDSFAKAPRRSSRGSKDRPRYQVGARGFARLATRGRQGSALSGDDENLF